jgi:hypothetical protein
VLVAGALPEAEVIEAVRAVASHRESRSSRSPTCWPACRPKRSACGRRGARGTERRRGCPRTSLRSWTRSTLPRATGSPRPPTPTCQRGARPRLPHPPEPST